MADATASPSGSTAYPSAEQPKKRGGRPKGSKNRINQKSELVRGYRGVCEITGLSRMTIHTMVKAKEFPAPMSIGPNALAWSRGEIDEWLASRPRGANIGARQDAYRGSIALRGEAVA